MCGLGCLRRHGRRTAPLTAIAVAALLTALLGTTSAAAAVPYVAIDLSADGVLWKKAAAINNHGLVVGWTDTDPTAGSFMSLLTWDVYHATQDLGPLDATYDSVVNDINDAGQLAGSLILSNNPVLRHGYFADGAGPAVDLATAPAEFSTAHAINNRGHVAGRYWDVNDDLRAYLYDGTTRHDLFSLGGDLGLVQAMNDAGTIVGAMDVAGFGRQAFAYQGDTVTPIPLLNSNPTTAVDVNQVGLVLGMSQASHGGGRPFLWTQADGLTDLGRMSGGFTTAALALNDVGQVVGTADGTRGFLWSADDGYVDLNNLLPDGPGWTVTSAHDINDAGVILATGTAALGVTRPLILMPARPGDFNGDGIADTQDINPFILAMQDIDAYATTYPDVFLPVVDPNRDGVIDTEDINPFVSVLVATGSGTGFGTGVPEPSSVVLLAAAVGCLGCRLRCLRDGDRGGAEGHGVAEGRRGRG